MWTWRTTPQWRARWRLPSHERTHSKHQSLAWLKGSARTQRLGLCHNTLTPARTPRLGLCHNTLTPARTPRLGLRHNTLTPARTPGLGLCHNTLIVVVDGFYIALFSTLEQTHCANVILHSFRFCLMSSDAKSILGTTM